jgi:hypothetical protein
MLTTPPDNLGLPCLIRLMPLRLFWQNALKLKQKVS